MSSVKIVDLIENLGEEPFFACEFFPPKTSKGIENLLARVERMAKLGALFASITWGAGGTSSETSLELASSFQNKIGIPTLLHLTCTNMDQEILDNTLKAAKEAGIQNILALRGDPPREDYTQRSDFSNAADLVKYIKRSYGDQFCIGVAGYPEGHAQGAASEPSVDRDIPFLKEKVDAGADFIITQLFYDPTKFESYVAKVNKSLDKKIPIIPGLMPINTYKTFLRSAKLSSASIPKSITEKLSKIEVQDDEQVKNLGIEILVDLIKSLQSHGVKGFHFYTLNLEKSVTEIVKQCHLAKHESTLQAWDDFTNGRFTDPDSAAFGEIDGYGPVVHGAYDGAPNPEWGDLYSTQDVANLLVRHITNEIEFTPFADQPLSAETSLIQEELISLNTQDIWTLASQPAVDAAPSNDKFFGWGPKDGKIFQMAFVEIVVDRKEWRELKQRLDSPDNTDFVYYAVDAHKNFQPSTDSRTVVTWGEWKHTLQSTIISEESIKAWGEEFFDILKNWQGLYPRASKTYAMMGKALEDRVLVTIICKDVKNGQKLWDLLGAN